MNPSIWELLQSGLSFPGPATVLVLLTSVAGDVSQSDSFMVPGPVRHPRSSKAGWDEYYETHPRYIP